MSEQSELAAQIVRENFRGHARSVMEKDGTLEVDMDRNAPVTLPEEVRGYRIVRVDRKGGSGGASSSSSSSSGSSSELETARAENERLKANAELAALRAENAKLRADASNKPPTT